MQPPNQFHHQHPNGIMTAPRPGRFANRFGSDGENIGGLGGVTNNAHHVNSVPRKNLFSPNVAGGNNMAPPLLPQSNGKMKNQRAFLHNEENRINSSYTPMKSQHGHAALAPFTPERGTTPRTTTTTPGGLRDSSAAKQQPQQYQCGLSAMISLETSYRTPVKSTTKKKKQHRRNPSSVSRLFPTPTQSATPMRMTPATTTKKHKRSTSSVFMLSTPTRTTTTTATTTPMRTTTTTTGGANNNNHVTNTPEIKRELINWELPNTDTKLMITSNKPSHRRTPSRFQLTPQKQVFDPAMEDSSSSSSSEEHYYGGGVGGSDLNKDLSSMETEDESI
eukprot:scaffold15908_cov72-Skeletonema_dohrnii-CCMP3373.AAC.1